jgi:biotin operon repressor
VTDNHDQISDEPGSWPDRHQHELEYSPSSPVETINSAPLLLAWIRAIGSAPSSASFEILQAASRTVSEADRQLLQLSHGIAPTRQLVIGWHPGASPNIDQYRSASLRRLSTIPNLALAVCFAAAWPEAIADPYPGRAFKHADILQACCSFGVHQSKVMSALNTTLPQAGLVIFSDGIGRLGPAAATIPLAVWSSLRRSHDRLPHEAYRRATSEEALSDSMDGLSHELAPPRRLPAPLPRAQSADETTVRAILTALEFAQMPIAHSDIPALSDPAIRRSIETILEKWGRALVSTPNGAWTTGYLDPIVEKLRSERVGLLTPSQRAVLALILLRTVAIPRAQGRHHHDGWFSVDKPVSLDALAANRHLSRTTISEAIRGLREAGYVTRASAGGYFPGPALARLSPLAQARLWEDLIVLGRPDGYLAEQIRSRRSCISEIRDDGALQSETSREK